MGVIGNLIAGFSQALALDNLLFALIGVALGSLVGVLPGIGPLGAMSLLLCTTFGMTPLHALIFFAGIYYGSMYGGSTTSILLNVPGESTSVVTCIDGYQMCQKGRAGAALFIAAAGSFVAGTLSVLGLMLFAPLLADFALKFGPPEYFSLTSVGLAVLTYISSGSKAKALLMVLVGMMISMIGMDPVTGNQRFTLGFLPLSQGIDFVPVAMGLFGISEVLNIVTSSSSQVRIRRVALRELLPSRTEISRSVGPVVRGSFLGFFIGLVPGPAAVISSFSSYALEKRLSKRSSEFGHGAVEGVAGPEAANNAAAGSAFLPLMALGIPFAPPMALILAAMIIGGILPGPTFIQENPDLFWTFIASMYIGNVMLVLLNLPLVGLFVSVLRTPAQILLPVVAILCLIGVYAVNSSSVDVWVLVFSGVLGYVLRARGYDLAPLVLAIVLGPKVETYFRQSLSISGGDYSIFVTRPISLTIALLPLAIALGWWLFHGAFKFSRGEEHGRET
ncbi:MAG: transporter [Deltaproteobacteria bacterium RBG_13_51_10]|nr:MAG: transporter [Deltaproteobacteria bacterium RBG_13_51_10]